MSNLEMIQALCSIVEKQNHIIKEQAASLEQLGGMCLEEEIRDVNMEVDYFLGSCEDSL